MKTRITRKAHAARAAADRLRQARRHLTRAVKRGNPRAIRVAGRRYRAAEAAYAALLHNIEAAPTCTWEHVSKRG